MALIINKNEMARKYIHLLKEKTKEDICWTYIVSERLLGVLNIKESQQQMKEWRKMALQGKLKIMDYNNVTKNIFNKEWHILVVQSYEDGEHVPQNPDPVGCMLMGYMVGGYIYAFQKKENRDDVANYVMKGLAR